MHDHVMNQTFGQSGHELVSSHANMQQKDRAHGAISKSPHVRLIKY